MIWPGVKRSPPMASELERNPEEPEAGREPRSAGAVWREGALCALAGASVSSALLASSPTSVASVAESNGRPQSEQKRAAAEDSAPHEEQNIRMESYHQAQAASLLREALHLHGGSVGEDFGYALHYFGGVIAHGDDRIGAVLGGMLQQHLVCRLLLEKKNRGLLLVTLKRGR